MFREDVAFADPSLFQVLDLPLVSAGEVDGTLVKAGGGAYASNPPGSHRRSGVTAGDVRMPLRRAASDGGPERTEKGCAST